MPGRPKAIWAATIRSIGRTMVPKKGIHTIVRIQLEREPGREIEILLSLEESKKWRDAFNYFIDKTEKGE